jgi:hypothetical protein
MNLYLIYFYGVREGRLVSDLHSTAETLEEAEDKARRASLHSHEPHDHYSVEGGEFEVGGWENPVFEGGKRIR